MFKNFLYVLKCFKTSSILNILGLSVALTVFIALITQVSFDFSFDRSYKNADDIYLYTYYSYYMDAYGVMINTSLGDDIAAKTPLMEAHTTIGVDTKRFYVDGAASETAILKTVNSVKTDFIKVFTPTVLEGDFAKGISEGNNLALSETTAKLFFGNASAIGKTLTDYYSGRPYTVQAVIKDFPKNSTLKNGVFTFLNESDPSESSFLLFMQVKKDKVPLLEEYLNSEEFLGKEAIDRMEENPTYKTELSLTPLTSIHLHFPQLGEGRFYLTLALLTIGILTLLIAYINFVNFTMALAPARVRTLNIQRILGKDKISQQFIIATESVLYSLMAFLIALFCVDFIAGSFMNQLFSADLYPENNKALFFIVGMFVVLLGFLIGLSPAKYLTNFDITALLKGSQTSAVRSSKLRSILIIIQFATTTALLILTVFIKIQYDYMINYSWGIEKDNIVYISSLNNAGVDYRKLGDEIMKDTRITDYTASRFVPGNIQMGWGRVWMDKKVNLKSWPVADNYLDFFGVKVIYGDDFPLLNNPEREKAIFNEAFLKKYDFKPEEVLGKEFPAFDSTAYVMGIAKDFNFESLLLPIEPMIFVTLSSGYGLNDVIFLKLTGTDISGAINHIKTCWSKFSSENCEVKFLDASLESLYRTQSNQGKLIGLFALVAIIIAIMGIYGMMTFNTKYRRSEIALRKINGAEVTSILLLLNKHILWLLLVGFVLSVPIAYFLVSRMLSIFAFRTQIYWWVFLLVGVLMLLITVATTSLQTYRAATANPIESLKSE